MDSMDTAILLGRSKPRFFHASINIVNDTISADTVSNSTLTFFFA